MVEIRLYCGFILRYEGIALRYRFVWPCFQYSRNENYVGISNKPWGTLNYNCENNIYLHCIGVQAPSATSSSVSIRWCHLHVGSNAYWFYFIKRNVALSCFNKTNLDSLPKQMKVLNNALRGTRDYFYLYISIHVIFTVMTVKVLHLLNPYSITRKLRIIVHCSDPLLG